MADPITISSDRDLVTAARSGDDDAWRALDDRHHAAVEAVARSLRPSGARSRAAAAMAEVRHAVEAGEFDPDGGDVSAPAAPALRDVRCRSLAALTGGSVGPALPGPHHTIDEVHRTELADRRDLSSLAEAFLLAPWAWQTVLWHGLAEGRPAAEISPMLGRSPNDVAAAIQSAEAGLFELYMRCDAARIGDLDPTSASLVGMLGGYRRGVLSPNDRRRVDDLLDRRTEGQTDGLHAVRWLAVGAALDTMVPDALVPGLTGQSPASLRAALGVGLGAISAAGLAAERSERVERSARLGAVLAVVLAIMGAAFLIRNPFDGLDAEFVQELVAAGQENERATTTTLAPATTPVPPTTLDALDTVDDRIDLVFPGARQGAVYVPGQTLLDLSAELTLRTPFVAGGVGSIGAAITNNAETTAHVTFDVRTTEGLTLLPAEAVGATCGPAPGGFTTCSFTLRANATSILLLVFELDPSVRGTVTIVPSIPGRALDVEIV